MEFRIIKGEKIRAKRGTRSLRDIEAAAGNAFTYSALRQWEQGDFRPGDDKVPILLAALGCDFEDISEPASIALAK